MAGAVATDTDAAPDPAGAVSAEADTGAAPTIEEAQQAYRDFTECMRNEGVPMAPAVFDAQGRIDVDSQADFFTEGGAGTQAELSATQEQAAEAQCIPDNAEALLSLITPDASEIRRVEDELSGELDEQMTKLAVCMRREFPDFPDPVSIDLDFSADEDVNFEPFPGISLDDEVYAAGFDACGREVGVSIPRT